MPYNVTETFGMNENILDSEVGLVTKTRYATKSMATDVDGRKVIKAGSLYTNPDVSTEFGVFLEDHDMTDYDNKPVAIVFQGRLKADKCASTVTAKKDDFAKTGLYLV